MKKSFLIIGVLCVLAGVITFTVIMTTKRSSNNDEQFSSRDDDDEDAKARAEDVSHQRDKEAVKSYTPDSYSCEKGSCKYRAFSSCGPDSRTVAFTFDDGPDVQHDSTRRVLAELADLGVPATFFVSPAASGEDKLREKCSLIRDMLRGGHDVEVHTWNHPMLSKIDKSELRKQIVTTKSFINHCGGEPTFFRPPYGIMNEKQANYVSEELGLTVAMWNVAPGDSDKSAGLTRKQLYDKVIDQYKSEVGEGYSTVILLHDPRYYQHVGVLRDLVAYFRSLNYKFVTSSGCYATCSTRICKDRGGPRKWKDVLQF